MQYSAGDFKVLLVIRKDTPEMFSNYKDMVKNNLKYYTVKAIHGFQIARK